MRSSSELALKSLDMQIRQGVIPRMSASRDSGEPQQQEAESDIRAGEGLTFLNGRGREFFGDRFDARAEALVAELLGAERSIADGEDMAERATYRVLDSIHELVVALDIGVPAGLEVLRRESLRRLYRSSVRQADRPVIPAAMVSTAYIACAIALTAFTIRYVESPTSWFLTATTWIIFGRLAQLAAGGQASPTTSP